MHLLICLVFFQQMLSPLTGGIYDVTIKSNNGTEQSLSAYKGKTMLVALVSYAIPNARMLGYLDSLQRTNGTLQVVVVPILELNSGEKDKKYLEQPSELLSGSFLVTEGMWFLKGASGKQHALLRWLTKKEENAHFDLDSLHQGQMFLVSGHGTLYCVINSGTLYAEIDRIIKSGNKA